MKNYLRTRQFTNTEELIECINEYFEEEEFIMIETLYKHLGIYKHDFRNWRDSKTNKKFNLWAKIIHEAKREIHSHLARVTAYGQTEQELEATKVLKSEGDGKQAWEFNRADPKVIKSYLNSRFKDNWDAEEVKEISDGQVTITFGNLGGNKIA